MNRKLFLLAAIFALCSLYSWAFAQSLGSAGTVEGVVTDPTEAVIRGATVEIQNAVTGFKQTTTTDDSGNFRFTNVPPNPYHLHVSASGFKDEHQEVTVRSLVPINLKIALPVGSVETTIT